jgi:MYXO-CTERM domain-containing protein
VNFGDQNLFAGTAPTGGVGSSTDYVNAIFNVTADSVNTNLTFSGQWTGGENNYGTILDDVSVTPNSSTPEPATLAFTALGLAALGSMLRRPLKTPAPRD